MMKDSADERRGSAELNTLYSAPLLPTFSQPLYGAAERLSKSRQLAEVYSRQAEPISVCQSRSGEEPRSNRQQLQSGVNTAEEPAELTRGH
ncbi:unnamed protein product [Vitrella brassicaformis CCMP3155]|uniref:Uncharacterized protein n=1 Tax=Vitrella brassicaformis (strain CCMP3155) TaxID=1169540 RepID=A0A0G4EC06_VITBC|nr:unnamed protein product [Vitrella brassicaformis CCMP3155]|mmetsp:Transcript_14199/g.33800  ORF Transcript_14199/g.33800 Transcript_14199/m.33800 type:complete len:91 (+) Transcript_14199:183-455(+)|eukprot:CEL93525.1 unnamed protein product [Vitrella brassicaformis CCMP3155]